jgi:hypothetical protein
MSDKAAEPARPGMTVRARTELQRRFIGKVSLQIAEHES